MLENPGGKPVFPEILLLEVIKKENIVEEAFRWRVIVLTTFLSTELEFVK